MLATMLCAVWFFIPAGVANAMPIFAAKLPLLKHATAPMDLGLKFHGKRVLGDHKTWRGLVAGTIAATLTFWVQQILVSRFSALDVFTNVIPGYTELPLVLGALLGVGALIGDAAKSFFKRRRGTEPGDSWFPFDQIDYIIGAALLSLLVVHMPGYVYLWAFVLWPTIHIVSTAIGYLLGLKDQIL